jgi:arylsulfatase A-like enzyme
MNVVVVVARGLRTDMVGCYGNLWIATPNLDMLAAGGVLFDWHFADRPGPGEWRSWLTGRYHFAEPAGDTFNLLEQLRANGVATYLVRDTRGQRAVVEPAGWDRVVAVESSETEEPLDQPLTAADKALKKLAKNERWLLWVELATLLPPWDTPADFQQSYFEEGEPEHDEGGEHDEDGEQGDPDAEETPEPVEPLPRPALGPVDPNDDDLYYRMQSTFAAAVSYLDAGIGLLLDKVRDVGDDTLVLVTSDAGFPLGEHGIVGLTDAPPHEELIHLPLLVRLPGGAEAGRRVAGLTQAVDLAPTLAEAFGLRVPDAHGRSLRPLLRGTAENVRDYAVTEAAGLCLRTPEWALLLPPAETGGKPQLFVKSEDRSEVNDVTQHHLEWSEYLQRLLGEFVAATRRPGRFETPALRDVV